MEKFNVVEIPEPPLARLLFANSKLAWLWLVIRVYVGWEWLSAGLHKLSGPAWIGAQSGSAVKGFLMGALQKTAGDHPDVAGWYAQLIRNVAIPHAAGISHLVVYAEITIGILLILGLFTGIAAFCGAFMNINYLFAGAISTNPILLLLELFLILAWRIAGWYGVDRFMLHELGTPWDKGKFFQKV